MLKITDLSRTKLKHFKCWIFNASNINNTEMYLEFITFPNQESSTSYLQKSEGKIIASCLA